MQINRLFQMIYLLLHKKVITAKDFASYFEVSTRTIYRDVEHLSSAGIPIYMTKGKGGGISLISNFVLNKTLLTNTEKTEILSAMHAIKAVNLEESNTALQKLSALFGGQNTDWVEVDFCGWANGASGQEEAELFAILKDSIISKKQIIFLYYGVEYSTKRVVEPLKLCFKGQNWYLYAYCTLRKDFRFFKLRRMKELLVSHEIIQRVAPSKVLVDESSFGDDMVTLTLKLSKEMAYRVYDEFHQYQTLYNGDFIAEITMPKGEWIYHYIATFGEYCEILSPDDVRGQVKEKLQKTLQRYL